MKVLKALALGLVLAFVSGQAIPATKVVSWQNPITNTDESSLPPELIEKTTVVWAATQAGLPTSTSTQVVTGSATSTTITVAPGTWFVAAKTTAKNGGGTSVLSAAAQFTVATPVPNPPTNVTVTSEQTTAFQVIGTLDKFTLLPVGTVPAGTACNPAQSVNGHLGVPRASVSWFGSVKPQAVVAKCDG